MRHVSPRKLRTLHEFQMEQLADREEAIAYLQVTLEEYQIDGNISFFLDEIQTIVEAQGGILKFAKQMGIESPELSDALSSNDAPRIDILSNIFHTLGCRLSIEPLQDVSLRAGKDYAVA